MARDFLIANNRARRPIQLFGRTLASKLQGTGEMWISRAMFESEPVQVRLANGRLVCLKAPPGYFDVPEEEAAEVSPPAVEAAPSESEVEPEAVEESSPEPVEAEEPPVPTVEASAESTAPAYTQEDLQSMTLKVLRPMAADMGMVSSSNAKKAVVIDFILGAQ